MKPGTLIPLLIFVGTLVVLVAGLDKDPRLVPSPLINRPAPAFFLPDLLDPDTMIGAESIRNQVALINVWASWCGGCRREHKLLVNLARTGEVPILGLDYKDDRGDALQWLEALGNPYITVAYDKDGRTGIDYGVYGVPETYVVDQNGVIRYKHTGPLTDAVLEQYIIPLIKTLKAGDPDAI